MPLTLALDSLNIYLTGNRTTHSEMLAQLENYECLASINLNAVTQTNVPEPFSSSSENQQLDSHLDMPGLRQRVKFTASDLQGTMYPGTFLY